MRPPLALSEAAQKIQAAEAEDKMDSRPAALTALELFAGYLEYSSLYHTRSGTNAANSSPTRPLGQLKSRIQRC